MKKILYLFLSILFVISFWSTYANIDSTRASWISSFDVNYLPAGNNCGYSIWYVLWYHEWYLRKYVALMPVKVDADSILDSANISTFWCNYNKWKNYKALGNKVCKDNYLKNPFVLDNTAIVSSENKFMDIIITGDSIVRDGNKLSISWSWYISFSWIDDIVSNKDDLKNITYNWVKNIVFWNTWINITLSWWIEKKIDFSNINIYPSLDPIKFDINEKNYLTKYVVSYSYLNYSYTGNIKYDLNKLYYFRDFRNTWKWLTKVWSTLYIRPIDWTNYTHYRSVYFDWSNVKTSWNWKTTSTSNYKNNDCINEFWAWNRWWVSSNQHKWVTSYATNIWLYPNNHKNHVCASTYLKIKDNYIDWSRSDILKVTSIKIWLDWSTWNISRDDSILSCDNNVLNKNSPKDAKINVNNVIIKVNWSGKKIWTNFNAFTTDSNEICLSNINIDSLPIDYEWDANHVHVVKKSITALELVVRPWGSTINRWDSWKIDITPITSDNTNLWNRCFNIRWESGYEWWFKKATIYNVMLKLWTDDWIRGNSPLFTINLLPNNNYKLTNISTTNLDSTVYADGKTSLKLSAVLTDSFWNIVDKNNIVKSIITENGVILNEINNNTWWLYKDSVNYDWNGKLSFNLAFYNNKLENNKIKFKFNLKHRNLDSSFNSSISSVEVKKNISINPILKTPVLTWENSNQILSVNSDVKLKFLLPTNNFNTNNSNITNVKVKWEPKITTKEGKDVTSKINIVASTGYENILSNLIDWSYSSSLIKNNNNSFDLWIRLEPKEALSTEYTLWWKLVVSYNLYWAWWTKKVVKYMNINSNLNFKYWGVYVVWSYTNNSKWLYEILRKSKSNMAWSANSVSSINSIKNRAYSNFVRKWRKLVMSVGELWDNNKLADLDWIYYNKWKDIILKWWNINWKSLVYVEWWNVIISWNIIKNWWILTIVAKSDENGNWGYIEIDPSVTNIDAILVTEKWIFPTIAMEDWKLKNSKIWEIVKWKKNSKLNNQLVIYWMVISKWNTIWWSIKVNWKYVLPWWKEIEWTRHNFYEAARFDLNYLRRYHINFNKWNTAQDPIKWWLLNEAKYWTYPVVIIYDNSIRTSKPYWL